MGLIQDAFKDLFGGKKMAKEDKKQETELEMIARLEKELADKKKQIELVQATKEIPLPPKFEAPKHEHIEQPIQELSIEGRLEVLEHNVLTILNEFNQRLIELEKLHYDIK